MNRIVLCAAVAALAVCCAPASGQTVTNANTDKPILNDRNADYRVVLKRGTPEYKRFMREARQRGDRIEVTSKRTGKTTVVNRGGDPFPAGLAQSNSVVDKR
jgi:hypothetical protein